MIYLSSWAYWFKAMGQESLHSFIQTGRKFNPSLALFSTGLKAEKDMWYIQLCLGSYPREPVLSNLIIGPAHLEHELRRDRAHTLCT